MVLLDPSEPSSDEPLQLDRLRSLIQHTRPVSTADQRRLDVGALAPLFPDGGLRRGSFVQVTGGPGATSMALALVAEPTRTGSWVAVLGGADMGWAAAAELGLDLRRVAVVRADIARTGSTWVEVAAALIDAFDVVVLDEPVRPSAGHARRLRSRARERGAVLVVLATSPSSTQSSAPSVQRRADVWGEAPDVQLVVTGARWEGLGDLDGWGHLRRRRLSLEVAGRRGADRVHRAELWVPGPDGTVAPVEEDSGAGSAPVTPLRRVG